MKYVTFVVAMLLGCGGLVGAAEHEHHMAATAPSGPVGVVSLDVYPQGGRLNLLTAAGSPARMSYQVSVDGGRTWSVPVVVGKDQPAPSPIHRGMDAQIAAAPDGAHLVAAWTTAGTSDRFGRGPIATAVSADGGKSWVAGPNPADDGQSTGHAFLDLAADAKGAFHFVWLDGRDGATGKGLRYARSEDFGGHWGKNQTLDAETCECCWNTLITRGDGSVSVLYRDRGPRDMALISSGDGGRTWGTATTVGPFAWDVNVCPHTGGGLAFGAGGMAFATVWTGAAESLGAYFLSSGDGGRSWSVPVRLGGDARAWHTDLAVNARTGGLAAVYDAHTEDTPGVFVVTSGDQGKTWSVPRRLTAVGTSASHPRVVATEAGFRVFWTDAVGWGSVEVR